MTTRGAQSLLAQLGITVPIFQAPIGPAATPALVNAVAAAGGFGLFAGSALGPDRLAAALDEVAPEHWNRCGVNIINAMPGDDILDLAIDRKCRAISFFWGINRIAIAKAKAAGACVLQTVGSGREAKEAVDAGADIVVAQGWEAGGHVWGQTSTLALIPEACAAAGHVPVVAAGGIASGASLDAALCLGAQAVWLGTRFVASEESGAHRDYKDAIVRARAQDAVYGTLYDVGWPDAPARALSNSTLRAWQAAGCPNGDARPGVGEIIAQTGTQQIPRYFVDIPTRATTGSVEAMAQYAGQSAGQVSKILPAAQIIAQMIQESQPDQVPAPETAFGLGTMGERGQSVAALN